MKEDNNIEFWYKSIVDNNDEFPPEEAWNSIQDELDIDLVWPKITVALDTQKQRSKFFYLSIAASLIILLGIGGMIIYLANKSSSINNVNVTEKVDDVIEVENHIFPVQNIYESNIVLSDNENPNNSQFLNIINMPTLSENVLVEQHIIIDELSVEPILLAHNSIEITNQSNIEIADQFENWTLQDRIGDNYAKRAFSNLYVGLTGQFANTWMLNNKTYTGLKSDELTATNLSFGKNFGVLLGSSINDKIALEAELFWQNKQKQSYNEYLNGKYITNTIMIDYYSILLQMKYTLNQNTGKHNVALGAYTDIMKNAFQDINGLRTDVKEDYHNYNYGIYFGYEYPIKITPQLYFNTGIGARIGLNNVFSGNEIIPDYLNETRNASLNLSFSLVYSIL
ncbi:MAG: hypothetical protein KGZ97_02905 [Bacteroidetes bacterium]|nr:hypothetical protein [Bacteroidota bacterium]